MIKNIPFDEANAIIEDESGMGRIPVSCYMDKDGPGHILTCWKLSDEDIDKIQETKRIWLIVEGETQPSMAMVTNYIFKRLDEEFPEIIDGTD